MSPKKRILLVDDHPLYRDGLKSRLEIGEGFEIVGEAGGFEEGMRLAGKVRPDLAVVDISLPDGSGLELCREMMAILPGLAVVIVSMHSRIDFITAAFQTGASAYMSKESGSDEIIKAIKAAAAGKRYLDGSLSPKVLCKLDEAGAKRARSVDSSYGSLSLREQQIMRLLAEGLSPKEIADKLFVTPKTVNNHRYAIMSKLGLKTSLDFVRHAARLGLIVLEDDSV